MVTESRLVVGVGKRGWNTKGLEKLFEGMDMFVILKLPCDTFKGGMCSKYFKLYTVQFK